MEGTCVVKNLAHDSWQMPAGEFLTWHELPDTWLTGQRQFADQHGQLQPKVRELVPNDAV